jgi:hypothetical protein
MTNRDDRPDLRDIEPIAPAPEGAAPGTAEPGTADPVDRPGVAVAAGSTGMAAGNVVGDPTEPEPASLDPERDDVARNAAGGGWEGANEVIENDFETEQLRRS